MFNALRTIWLVFLHAFGRRATVQYPEERRFCPRGAKAASCSRATPAAASGAWPVTSARPPAPWTALHPGRAGRKRAAVPGVFPDQLLAVHLLRVLEEACPTCAMQLTPDFEMGEYRRPNMVYEKEDLLIDGQGKYHGTTSGRSPRGDRRQGQRPGRQRAAARGYKGECHEELRIANCGMRNSTFTAQELF